MDAREAVMAKDPHEISERIAATNFGAMERQRGVQLLTCALMRRQRNRVTRIPNERFHLGVRIAVRIGEKPHGMAELRL